MINDSQDFIDQVPEITARQALRLFKAHGASLVEFLTENPIDSLFSSEEVISYLGY